MKRMRRCAPHTDYSNQNHNHRTQQHTIHKQLWPLNCFLEEATKKNRTHTQQHPNRFRMNERMKTRTKSHEAQMCSS